MNISYLSMQYQLFYFLSFFFVVSIFLIYFIIRLSGDIRHNPIGGGSRLPTRSNRKAIATGNLRPRRPVRCSSNYAAKRVSRIQNIFIISPVAPRNLCRLFACSGGRGRPPLQIFVHVPFGCRGRRPRRPVRCSSNYTVINIICAVRS